MKQSRHANGKLALLRGTNFNSLYSLLFYPGVRAAADFAAFPIAMPATFPFTSARFLNIV